MHVCMHACVSAYMLVCKFDSNHWVLLHSPEGGIMLGHNGGKHLAVSCEKS